MKSKKLNIFSVVAIAALSAVVFADGASSKSVPPTEALTRLKEGNIRFVDNSPVRPRSDAARRAETAQKQTPFATVLTCADSRLSPEIIFDQGIGDLFVARVAGNTFDKEILGSIEYSVAVLGSRLIVVMGHERCGAVDAAIKGGPLPGSIGAVTVPIKPAVKATEKHKDHRLDHTIAVNADLQAKRLLNQSKILRDLVKKGELKIVSSTYDLDSGLVTFQK